MYPMLCRKGERQPDNFEGIKHGPINAENNIGITIEGLQEFHDEACLAVLNNKYNDGISWHDVACRTERVYQRVAAAPRQALRARLQRLLRVGVVCGDPAVAVADV